jgi:hypothetical protein
MAGKTNIRRKTGGARNEYRCSVEKNKAGKQSVRIRARFARQKWELSLYFLAPSRPHALRKLERVLRFLQLNEERLWFWGADRRDDPNFSAELLSEMGLKLDSRAEFPQRFSTITLAPDRPMAADQLVLVRRDLSQSRESPRTARN